jgi:drug/metabolite transporter (DMT)-like permease
MADTAVEAQVAEVQGRRRNMPLFVLLLVLVNLVWAGQATAVKHVQNHLGPFAIAFLPFCIITPLLIPLLFQRGRSAQPRVRPSLSDWKQFVVAGLGGQLVAQLGMTWGATKGQASSCAILYLLIPVITAVLASFMLRERITALRIVCLGIGLGGVLLMSAQDLLKSSFVESKYLAGNLLMLIGCLGASFYNVYCKGLMQRFHERDILIYSYITAAPAGVLILWWMEPDCLSRLAHLDAKAWLAMAFLTLLVYGISMLMFFYVLQYLPVTVALASTYLVPVFGVVIAMLLLGEQLSRLTLLGALVVLAATILIMKYDVAKD